MARWSEGPNFWKISFRLLTFLITCYDAGLRDFCRKTIEPVDISFLETLELALGAEK